MIFHFKIGSDGEPEWQEYSPASRLSLHNAARSRPMQSGAKSVAAFAEAVAPRFFRRLLTPVLQRSFVRDDERHSMGVTRTRAP